MNKQVKKQWVKALRSGKINQARMLLETDTGMCCLGVLRRVMDPKDKSSAKNGGELLSRKQLKKAGLTNKQQLALAELNDLIDSNPSPIPVPFAVIAGFIDTYL